MKNKFGENIKNLRKKYQLNQEQLADKVGITPQAVSKWETGQAYPDVELLLELADVFDTTVEALLRSEYTLELEKIGHKADDGVPEEAEGQEETLPNGNGEVQDDEEVIAGVIEKTMSDLPDDGVLRIVVAQFRGNRLLGRNKYNADDRIYLNIDQDSMNEGSPTPRISIWGNAEIEGDVKGNVTAGGSVSCEGIAGDIQAGGGVNCESVAGDVTAGASVSCEDVGGSVAAGGNVECGDISGHVTVNGGSVSCGDVEGNINSEGDVECGDISGSVEAKGTVNCGGVSGNVTAGGNVKCGDISGHVTVNGGSVSCGDVKGNINSEGDVECGEVTGDVTAKHSICCGDVGGSVKGGKIECGDVV